MGRLVEPGVDAAVASRRVRRPSPRPRAWPSDSGSREPRRPAGGGLGTDSGFRPSSRQPARKSCPPAPPIAAMRWPACRRSRSPTAGAVRESTTPVPGAAQCSPRASGRAARWRPRPDGRAPVAFKADALVGGHGRRRRRGTPRAASRSGAGLSLTPSAEVGLRQDGGDRRDGLGARHRRRPRRLGPDDGSVGRGVSVPLELQPDAVAMMTGAQLGAGHEPRHGTGLRQRVNQGLGRTDPEEIRGRGPSMPSGSPTGLLARDRERSKDAERTEHDPSGSEAGRTREPTRCNRPAAVTPAGPEACALPTPIG